MPSFARPWRTVEGIPPAILQAWPDKDVKIEVSENELSYQAGRSSLRLTADACWCCSPGDDLPATSFPLSDLLGAKVECKGIEDRQVCTAIVLVARGHTSDAHINNADDADEIKHITIYSLAPSRHHQQQQGEATPAAIRKRFLNAVYTTGRLPLSVQEYIAAQINHFLERLLGPGSVDVENDLCIREGDDARDTTTAADLQCIDVVTNSQASSDLGAVPMPALSVELPAPPDEPSSISSEVPLPPSPLPPSHSSQRPPVASSPSSEAFAASAPICRPQSCTPVLPTAQTGVTITEHHDGRLSIEYCPPRGPLASEAAQICIQLSPIVYIVFIQVLAMLTQRLSGILLQLREDRCGRYLNRYSGAVSDIRWIHAYWTCGFEAPSAMELLWPAYMLSYVLWLVCYIKLTARLQPCYLGIEICEQSARVEASPTPLHCKSGSFAANLLFKFSASLAHTRVVTIDEPVVDVKVTVGALPLKEACLTLELHTASRVHRLTDAFWRLRGLLHADTMQPQAVETIAAAISRHLARRDDTVPDLADAAVACADDAAIGDATMALGVQTPIRAYPEYSSDSEHASLSSVVLSSQSTHASIFTPLSCGLSSGKGQSMHEADAGYTALSGTTTLGSTMHEMMETQAAAIRAANFQSADGGRWVSAEVPPRASAHIRLLSRSPGHLHMRLPWPTVSLGAAPTALLVLAASVVACFPGYERWAAWDAPPGHWTRLLAPHAMQVVNLCLAFLGTMCAVLALTVQRRAQLDVRVSGAGFSMVHAPWWLPASWAVTLSKWLPVFSATHASIERLAGAEVQISDDSSKADAGQRTGVVVHVRGRGAVAVVLMDAQTNAELGSFDVLDKLFVAGHINTCLTELLHERVPKQDPETALLLSA